MILPAHLAGMVILIEDIIPPNGPYCAWGARRWANARGFDFRALFAEGVPAEQLLACNDHHADEVVGRKIRRLT